MKLMQLGNFSVCHQGCQEEHFPRPAKIKISGKGMNKTHQLMSAMLCGWSGFLESKNH